MEIDKNCLWCNNTDSYPFCENGGQVRMTPVHIKGNRGQTVGSLCYNDQLASIKISRLMLIPLTDKEKFVISAEKELIEWHKQLSKPEETIIAKAINGIALTPVQEEDFTGEVTSGDDEEEQEVSEIEPESN